MNSYIELGVWCLQIFFYHASNTIAIMQHQQTPVSSYKCEDHRSMGSCWRGLVPCHDELHMLPLLLQETESLLLSHTLVQWHPTDGQDLIILLQLATSRATEHNTHNDQVEGTIQDYGATMKWDMW